VVIQRSPQGKFDSIVVQSSPLEQFPGGAALLHGRPIFTVYVPMGVGKDWSMFFCGPPTAASNAPNDPIEPPYPFRLLRPKISIPTYQKYALVHGFITEQGAVRDLTVIQPVKAETAAALSDALSQWTFRPATRQGAAVAVEFVIAVPAGTF
jgi:hypothetical protein